MSYHLQLLCNNVASLSSPCQISGLISRSYIEKFTREFVFCSRDVALYALGVGAPGADPCNATELPFVYHPEGQSSIKVYFTVAIM